MKSLLHCIQVLGLRMGWRYWRIERRCIRNPELVLLWAQQCREAAYNLYYDGFGDEGTLAVMKHWADRLEESNPISPQIPKTHKHMKPTTRIAIAGLLSAAGAVLSAFAAEFNGEPEVGQADPAPTTGGKRAPRKAAASAATADPATPETPTPADEPTEGGKTYDELKAAIAPFVQAGQGQDVKKIISKHDPAGNPPSLKTMPAQNHAAFLKDLEALSY